MYNIKFILLMFKKLLRYLAFKGQLALFLQLQGGMMQADSTLL